MKLDRQLLDGVWYPCGHLCGTDEPIIDREEGMVSADCHKSRPVYGGASLIAAVGHIRAILGKLNHLSALDQAGNFSAHSTSIRVGRVKLIPGASWR